MAYPEVFVDLNHDVDVSASIADHAHHDDIILSDGVLQHVMWRAVPRLQHNVTNIPHNVTNTPAIKQQQTSPHQSTITTNRHLILYMANAPAPLACSSHHI